MSTVKAAVDKLRRHEKVTDEELVSLLTSEGEDMAYLTQAARLTREENYGHDIYIRGLIEVSSFCKNDCLYCGIRRSNRRAERYRLTPDEIIACTDAGYTLGFRTFVLQGGEDAYYTDSLLCETVRRIKSAHPDCAVTLSLGERSRESYAALRAAGADRYLLRHETADPEHYAALHPAELSFENRMRCLRDLRELGYQTGCGFMVGSPGQTVEHIVKDLRFIEAFKPHMVGIGPFIPHNDTPFKNYPAGSVNLSIKCIAVVRLQLPQVLLPATTALGSAEEGGRERGILAGANVVMPNLSPADVRSKYLLYNNKLSTGVESAEGLLTLDKKLREIGCRVVYTRGDHISIC